MLSMGDVSYYGTYIFWCMCWSVYYILVIYLSMILLCVYVYIYMVHSIVSCGMCFYFTRESMFSIAYGVLYI